MYSLKFQSVANLYGPVGDSFKLNKSLLMLCFSFSRWEGITYLFDCFKRVDGMIQAYWLLQATSPSGTPFACLYSEFSAISLIILNFSIFRKFKNLT